MRVQVLLFAGLREAIGQKQIFLDLPDDASLAELMAALGGEHPAVAAYRGRLVISVNAERAPLDRVLRDGDEVALLPPVSGGSGRRRQLTEQPLSMDALIAEVVGDAMGGLVTFTGIVRDHSRGQSIDHLEYEAYGEMAERELDAIGRQVEQRWPEVRYAVSHRVGRLAIGEPAVMIAVAAPHRPAAFEACRFIIDTLKQTVPIWKKEFATSGAYWVEENP
jgi:molybdopterin synthase catalytic subunit